MQQKIKVNLIPSGLPIACYVSQYDEGRVIRCELYNGVQPYTLQENDVVTLNLRKPDNHVITATLSATAGNNYVDLVTTEQMTAIFGVNKCLLKITNTGLEVGTAVFAMFVQKDVLADGDPSQSVIEDLDALVAEAVGEVAPPIVEELVPIAVGDNYYNKTQTDAKIAGLIDDTQASASKVYSSNKVEEIADNKADVVLEQAFDIDNYTDYSINAVNTNWHSGYMTKGGVINSSNSLSYSDKIDVNEGDVFEFSNSNLAFRFVTAFNNDTAISDSGSDNTYRYIVPSGINKIVLSRYNTANAIYIYRTRPTIGKKANIKRIPMGLMTTADNLADGEMLSLPTMNVKNANRYFFYANISTFNKITFRKADAKVEINDTNIIIYNGSTVLETVAHGLTIANFISVLIENETSTYPSLIRISTNDGSRFDYSSNTKQLILDSAFANILSTGSTLTECRFSWVSANVNAPIWIFGDSYLSWYNTRWTYYLAGDNLTKSVMFNGYAGQNSINAFYSLVNLLKITVPKMVVWCLGMNDADTSSEVNASWYYYYQMIKELAIKYNFELVLYTTPTTPTQNNKFKNAIVTASGYRYVDIDGAVRIDEEGHWFAGALANDNVHPTVMGAKIIYNRFLADLPELMCNY